MRRGNATGTLLAAAFANAVSACSPEAAPRPQVVLVIDTDLAPAGQLLHAPDLALDGTTDTLRIDALDEKGRVYDSRELVVAELRDWPVSLGVAVDELAPEARLRIRSFRAATASRGVVLGREAWEPAREVTIDRLVRLRAGADGPRYVRVVLQADCLGRPSTFVGEWRTCLDGARGEGSPGEGQSEIAADAIPPTQAGSWAPLAERPCEGIAPAGAVCVPGGFSVLGDAVVSGWRDGVAYEDSVPLRPTIVSPFWMDETEVTVGQYRALHAAGALSAAPPLSWADTPSLRHCTWHGADSTDHDALPLNCIAHASAAEVCARRGGVLPSEAQWEHAARGRGQRRSFPWGDGLPLCCSADVDRFDSANSCPGQGPAPVRAAGQSPPCAVGPDASRDGVLGLAGNLREFTRDKLLPFDHSCWAGQAILTDPVCDEDSSTALVATRGGDWSSAPAESFAALRRGAPYWESSMTGFRCAYRAGQP